ncbi:MAG TPA: hypothetical protein VFA74_01365 [Terriglobales bacterium]|nr:hypothetical protein [Terriglobales bacterium]
MRRFLQLWMVTVGLTACGGLPSSAPVGFVNQTQHPDAALRNIWSAAQESVAHSIDLNPVERATANVPADIVPGNPRALTVMPHEILVTGETDVSSSVLFAATGILRADPTGMIACPQPCDVRYAPAYSIYQPPHTNYAASWEFKGNNFNQLLEYEFENQILNALGYDMRWR